MNLQRNFLLAIAVMMLAHSSVFAQTVRWSSLDGPQGGYTPTLTEDWDGTLYGQEFHRLYKSTDRGEHWLEINDDTAPHYGLYISLAGTFFRNDPTYNIDKSTDKGRTWNTAYSPFDSLSLQYFIFNRSGQILALMEDSSIFRPLLYRSSDDGNHWTPTTVPVQASLWELYGNCTDSAGNFYLLPSSPAYGVQRTTDFGNTWADVSPPGNTGFLDNIATTGNGTLVMGSGAKDLSSYTVYRSTNHGDSWDSSRLPYQYFIGPIAGGRGDTVYQMAYNNGDSIYPLIQRSTDAGKTWTAASPGLTQVPTILPDGFFVDPISGTLYCSSNGAGYWRSDDAGNHWKAINSGLNFSNIPSLIRTPKGSVLAMMDYSIPWRYANGVWDNPTLVSNQLLISSIGQGYLNAPDGSQFCFMHGGIFRTTNDGGSWQTQYGWFDPQVVPTSLYFGRISPSVFAVDSGNTFYAGLANNYTGAGLATSTDLGTSWHLLGKNGVADSNFSAIQVAQDQSVYAGAGNVIYRSDDRGNSWITLKTLATGHKFVSIAIANANLIFAASDSEGLFRTTDRGSNWTLIFTPGIRPFEGLYQVAVPPNFTDPNTIPIMVTAIRDTSEIFEPWLFDPFPKYIGYLSLDGGANWTVTPDSLQAYSAWFDSPTSIVVGTGNHGVWTATISSASVAANDRSFHIDLSPNPAHDIANVTLSLDRAEELSLELYDEAGKKVLAPIRGLYPIGNITLPMDLSTLPSGQYELRAIAGHTTEIEKLAIVR